MSTRKSSGIVKTLPLTQQNAVIKFLKRCWMPLAILIITAAVISSLFRALTPWAKQYKKEVEHHLSTLLGEPVSIHTMETGWYWFEPVIKLKQVSISDGKQKLIKLDKLLVGINIFSSLWHWQIQPGVLFLDELHLTIRQKNGQWQVDGLTGPNKSTMTWDTDTYKPILAWILSQQKIIIKNLSAQVYLQNGTLIPVREFNLTIANRSGRYRIKGKAHLAQTTRTDFQLLAEMYLDPRALNKTVGHAFFSVDDLLLAQWQSFFPQSRIHLLGGKGDIEVWADVGAGQLENVQARLDLDHLAWDDTQTQKNQLVQSLKANLAWNPTKEGWQLAGDHIKLRLGDTLWPENSLLVRYERSNHDYFVFIKNILLQSLCSTSIPWPNNLSTVLAMKPHGQFHDTQVHVKDGGIAYILTRFSKLGWLAQETRLGVDNLSGVIHWQPTEGRLELDGEKTVIDDKSQPPITFETLNAAFDWKELSHGMRLSMERLVLKHPNLLLSAQGVVDEISTNSAGSLRLTAEFSANDAHTWLPYLPVKHLKPKLAIWLKRDVKRIATASGELSVNGLVADFPFDKQPGEFAIKSYLTGVDLIFAPNWPLTKDIEGYLRVNKRALEADIVHADLRGIVIDKGNLSVNDIGLDKETLLIHSKITTDSGKAQSYILSSPLNKKLSVLNMLKMKGPLELDLQLEAPLYPENDDVLALGDLAFINNTVDVHHTLDDVQLNKLNGTLQFDQQGILDSDLKAIIMGYPVAILIKSIRHPEPYTEVRIKGKTTMDVVRSKFNLPVFSLMHGSLWLESLLTLTDDPSDLDHLRIHTSLQGLSIDLPSPLGKLAGVKTPLTIDIDFNPQKAIRLRFNYDNRLRSDLWFSGSKEEYLLQKGEILVGDSNQPPMEQKQKGLRIVGALTTFDLQEWLATWEKLSDLTTKKGLIDVLNYVEFKLREAKIWRENYKDLSVKAMKSTNNSWSIHLEQERLAANLKYQPSTNSLTGVFDKLSLTKQADANKLGEATPWTLKPAEMPNLDLSIHSFQFDGLNLGDVTLKTTRANNLWQLESFKMESPYYQLSAKGQWQQEGKINTTRLRADLHINDLAKSLVSWEISPVVEAHRGDVRFQGSWPGAFHDFSLVNVVGQMGISFKNGRITNLSPETEEKLGLGKLLSILSLQTIPRRLKLDFSDLSQAGYSFDEFSGSFTLAKGVLTTQDSYIDGPVAYASMKGNLDVVKQLYDLNLKVSPHITASLPIVATIAGGPIAGIATWVASKIINQGMQRISGYTYKISGPWRQPVVQQVSIIKKRQT
ncbi:TPA: YhdP family protein [Legionella feeleii]|nr:YhdP family protein [Legionella feeleii]